MKYVHTNLVCRDVEKLAKFYREVFECKQEKPTSQIGGDWLDKGTGLTNGKIKLIGLTLPGYSDNGPVIEMFEYNQMIDNPGPIAPNSKGFGHLAFKVDDVSAVYEKVVKNGGSKIGELVEKEFKSGILTFMYATDPEGNIIEIQSWKSK